MTSGGSRFQGAAAEAHVALAQAKAAQYEVPCSILDVTLAFRRDCQYAVKFSVSHAADPRTYATTDLPCFRFTLHYYGRVVFELARRQRPARHLSEMIDRIAATPLDGASDLFRIARVKAALASEDAGMTAIPLIFRAHGLRGHAVDGDLSRLRGAALETSVVAVCQAALRHLSPRNIGALPLALANMNASYELAHRHDDPDSQYEVPTIAYYAAALVQFSEGE